MKRPLYERCMSRHNLPMGKQQLAGPESKALRIALLGCIDVRVAEGTLDVGYAKLSGLLAFLAMSAGTPLRREYLAELFWPEMPTAAGRQNLRRALFNLKFAMGDASQLLSARRDVVTLSSQGLWLDVAEFTYAAPSCTTAPSPAYCNHCIAQMEQMAGLYHGEFMVGFSLPDCPDFEDWLQIQREALHRRALSILERLSNCHEQVSGYGRALPFALRYMELEPWDEAGHRRVMRLYELNGQNSAALGQYDFCCRMLEKELGVLPNEETQGLAESIRKGRWGQEHPCVAGDPPVTVLPPLITERRQVSVLYCELTPATIDDPDEIITRTGAALRAPTIDDSDEAMELLHASQARCAEIIRQFSGHIVQAHGGGLLAYFGYPQARENAARLAVQAALAVRRTDAHGIKICAAVHTGMIITGGDSSMPDMAGKTSRVAIQLCLGTAQNDVAISQQTLDLVAEYFDCIGLGVRVLPGVARPVEIFKVLRESGARIRHTSLVD